MPAEPAATTAPPFKIGLLLPPTEGEAQSILRGARLGVEHARRETGATVELIVRGSPGQWGTESDDAVALALDAGAQALIAPTGGATVHQAMQVAGRTRIPVVSLCGDSSVTGAGIPWTVRIVPRTDEEAQAIFQALAQPGRRLRVVAFLPSGRAGREASKDLRAAAAAVAGAELVELHEVPDKETAWADRIRPAVAAKPELALVWVEASAAVPLMRALRAAGFAGRLAGSSRLLTTSFVTANGIDLEGLLLPAPVAPGPDHPLRARFQRELASDAQAGDPAEPGGNAPPDFIAAASFDAVSLLAVVLEQAGGQPAFAQFPLRKPMPGATGDIAFDQAGNRRMELEVLEFRRGEWRRVALR